MNINVGNTKIIKNDGLYYKMENLNPTGSIKDRPAYYILKNYLDNKILKKGDTIIEATSGNMGIALAYFGLYFGLKVIIVMPRNVSRERISLLKKYQAKVVLVSGSLKEAYKVVDQMVEKYSFFKIDQFNNQLNKEAHLKTGVEILEDLPDVDIIISGIGTAGHICGIGEYIKKVKEEVLIIGIEPLESPIITKGLIGSHFIQGIGAGLIPPLLDLKIVDIIETVKSKDVIFEFQKNNPLGLGLSSIASHIVAKKYQELYPDKTILIIVCDDESRYQSLIA